MRNGRNSVSIWDRKHEICPYGYSQKKTAAKSAGGKGYPLSLQAGNEQSCWEDTATSLVSFSGKVKRNV